MKMMDNMMKGIIKGLPVEEREVLLLDMMPDMMKQVDMAKMMPGIRPAINSLAIDSSVNREYKIAVVLGGIKGASIQPEHMVPVLNVAE